MQKKEIPIRRYACCPICATKLFQAENSTNAVTKCEGCHLLIKVDIINGRVTTELYDLKSDV